MYCPHCHHADTRVLDSRVAEDGCSIRRRRACPACGGRFSTVEQMQLLVTKRSGASEPFARDKAVAGVRKACKGRPVTEDQLARLGQDVEDALRRDGRAEVPAHQVGLAVLGPLAALDEVAYLRFASVYRSFESAADFEAEIARLREQALERSLADGLSVLGDTLLEDAVLEDAARGDTVLGDTALSDTALGDTAESQPALSG